MSDTFEPRQGTADRFSEHVTAERGISPWVLGCGALLLAVFALGVIAIVVAGVVWFAVRPSARPVGIGPAGPARIIREPPVAEQALPDGSILVLEKVTYGRRHRFDFDVARPPRGPFSPLPSYPNAPVVYTETDSLVVWLTKWDSTKRKALDFDWVLRCAAVDAHGCEIENVGKGRNAYQRHGGSGEHGGMGPFSPLSSGPYDLIVTHFELPVIRHEGKTFKLRVYDTANRKVAEFDVPDPSPSCGSYPGWKPEPLPITKSDGDVSLTLTSLAARSSASTRTYNGIPLTRTRVRLVPQFETKQAGRATADWSVRSYRLGDAVGHESSLWDCKLCAQESAWQLEVKAWRRDTATFGADETWNIAKLSVPERQHAELINRSKTFQGATVELVAAGGAGSVSYPGLPAGYSGGYTTSGSSYFGQGKDRRRVPYRIRVDKSQTTVSSEAPHLLVRVTRLSSDQRLSLRLKDDEDKPLRVDGPRSVAASLCFWFLDVPENVETLSAELIVHKCRTFEFLVGPPNIEPAAPSPSSRSPRSPEQLLAHAQSAIANGKRAVAATPDNAEALNNLAWAYVTAPEELRDAKQAVALAAKAAALEPDNHYYINTLGTAYYRAAQYNKALSTLERNTRGRTDTMVCFDLYPLAMTYFKLDQTDKAKATYERAFQLHRGSTVSLSSTHWHELYEFRVEAATLFLGEPPKEVFERAGALARKGDWEPAAAEFAKVLDVYPDEHWQWYCSGALEAYLKHSDEYRRHCRKMLELFGDTQDPFIAERTGKLCMLLPDAVPHDPQPAQLIEKAVGLRPDVSWFQLASAIAEYRAGRFQDALDQLKDAEARATKFVYWRVLIELFRAMSQHQLGQQEAARGSLERAIGQLNSTAPKPEDEVPDYGPSWHDRLMCEVIRREAEALLVPPDAGDQASVGNATP